MEASSNRTVEVRPASAPEPSPGLKRRVGDGLYRAAKWTHLRPAAKKSVRLGRRAVEIARAEGARGLAQRSLGRAQAALETSSPQLTPPQPIRMLVDYDDASAVDWSGAAAWRSERVVVRDRGLRTAWIMHPPGESSGGAQNIFRFLRYLEQAGHHATIYFYDARNSSIDARYLKQLISRNTSYSSIEAEFRAYKRDVGVASGTDAIFATGWETAYPAFLDPSPARRFYFVQDFEPAFYPVGSEHQLAENTYRFGFEGITAGGWLADKLSREYGMKTASFGFAADLSDYRFSRTRPGRDIFFYARPVTTRRGFELGIMALQHVAEAMPDRRIHLAGWDTSGYEIPFAHENHGIMKVSDLNALYDQCAVGLVLSLTNLSLLPLELLATGVIPVMNKGLNNTLVTDNPFIRYADPSPRALASAVIDELSRPDAHAHALSAAESVASLSWDAPGRDFVRILTEAMRD